MPIIPDVKDWTWVLSEKCPECSFDPSTVTPATVPGTVRNMLPRWRAALRRPDVTERPDENTWSTLEYACHVRDVFSIFAQRLNLMLTLDNPTFENWDQDAAALDADYANADPAKVSAELTAEGEQIAEDFACVREGDWGRKGLRSNGSEFTVLTFSRYFLHDVVHHLHDVKG
ncbi:DinB family protein [Pseudarthrobacter sp. J64]|uniref:DinB family protein n=1 Tax=Pseudarthrobacter sp. J64 TaxID=3116485 RepID=UPI002E814F24|nr:DinB family protein [Pseudarthrobacter sp. J64]MEE2569658.1 DinB family protein [Pseudarthrobacter sp. J64]